jgi:DNA (cytosine-5)-methyltransferase 1
MHLQEINQLDLFSGIGGFHLGFERAGYKVNSYFSEVDKHAVAVYKNQFKDSTYVGSVTDVRGEDLPRIDLITFGSPCQDFSLAGKRKGMEGERSSLITEAIRLVHECRPRVFIWENVKGTFSSNDGADFWAIIQAFANIGGYRCEWQLCNTSWFLPQNRERIYLVGYLAETRGDWRGVFPLGEDDKSFTGIKSFKAGCEEKQFSSETSRTISSGTAKMARDQTYIQVKSNYTYKKVNETIEQNPNAFKEGEARMMDLHNRKVQDISPCLVEPHHNASAVYDGRPKIIGYTRDAKGKVTDRHLKDEAGTIHSSSGGGGNTDQFVQDVKVGTWRTHKDGQGFREVKGGNCPTIPARAREDGSGQPVIETSYRIRRLTPIECERLQGFPDNHTEYGNYDGEVKKMSNTQRYKQCGNAVTVDVVQAIANKLHPLFE